MRLPKLLLLLGILSGCQTPQPEPADRAPSSCIDDTECAPYLCSYDGICLTEGCPAQCPAGTVCAQSVRRASVCEPPGGRGELCFHDDDLNQAFDKPCAAPLVCGVIPGGLSTDGFCVPPSDRIQAEPCDSDTQCAERLLCHPFRFRCVAPLDAACESNDGCDSLLCGANGLCVPNECDRLFSPCSSSSTMCLGGECGRFCLPLAKAGERCFTDDGTCTTSVVCDTGLSCSPDGICAE
jgi:hypothetical protein